MKKKIIIAVLLVTAVTLVSGQALATRTTTRQAGKPPQQVKFKWGTFHLDKRIASRLKSGAKLHFVMVSYATSAPFWGPTRQGVKDAAKKFGLTADFIGPVQPSTDTQINEIESLITKGVDGLVVVSPDAKTLTPIINKAIVAGIPTFTSNIDAPRSNRFAFVGQQLVNSGKVAGREFLKAFYRKYKKGGGPYTVIATGGDVAQDYVRDRYNGFVSVVKPTGDFKIIKPVSTSYDNTQAYGVVENLFRANPSAKGLYMVDGTIVAGGTYLKRTGKAGKVIAVGFNFEPGTADLMKSGAIQASVGQYPYKQGYLPMQYLYQFLKTGAQPKCGPFCDVGSQVANQANVKTFPFKTTG